MNTPKIIEVENIIDELPESEKAIPTPPKSRIDKIRVRIKGTMKEPEVPYIASSWQTNVTQFGDDDPQPIYPPYVKNLTDGNLLAAKASLGREILLLASGELCFEQVGVEAPLAVCANVPADSFMIDWTYDINGKRIPERLVINEKWAEDRACDADGDRAMMLWNKGRTEAIMVKFPITKVPPRLKLIPGRAREHFYSLDMEDTIITRGGQEVALPGLKRWWTKFPQQAFGTNIKNTYPADPNDPDSIMLVDIIKNGIKRAFAAADERKQFMKAHTPVDVGLLTSGHNSKDLWKTMTKPLKVKNELTFRDPDRYDDIEGKGMKGARKDSKGIERAAILDFTRALQPIVAWGLTSAGSITRMDAAQAREFCYRIKMTPLMKRIRNLAIGPEDFREIKQQRTARTPPQEMELDWNVIHRLCGFVLNSEGERQYLPNLQRRIRVETLPHFNSLFPHNPDDPFDYDAWPVCLITLTLPNGEVAALTDIKRDDGLDQGLTYMYLLPPVWDCDELRFMHPIEKMNKEFTLRVQVEGERHKVISRFDSRIINPTTDEVVGYFGANTDPLGNFRDDFARYGAVKGSQLQAAIAEYCGEYGFPVDGTKVEGQPVPYATAYDTVSKTVVVDYMKDSTAEEMYEQIKLVNSLVRLCISGNKQTKRRVRKYALAHKNGVALWANQNSHIARPGKQMSQRSKALKVCKMMVAVVNMDSLTQCYITPTGVEKQIADNAFLPQFFATKQQYESYCRQNNIDPEDETLYERREYVTWVGEKRAGYIIGPRASIEVGKLIDNEGNKFMPRRCGQVYINDGQFVKDQNGNVFQEYGTPIDVVMPIREIINKYAHHGIMGTQPPAHLVKEIVVSTAGHMNGKEYVPGPDVKLKAVVFEHTFFRTGSASENIQGRWRRCRVRGLDAHKVCHEYSKMLAEKPVNLDLNNPDDLDFEYVGWREPNFEMINEFQEFGRLLDNLHELDDVPEAESQVVGLTGEVRGEGNTNPA